MQPVLTYSIKHARGVLRKTFTHVCAGVRLCLRTPAPTNAHAGKESQQLVGADLDDGPIRARPLIFAAFQTLVVNRQPVAGPTTTPLPSARPCCEIRTGCPRVDRGRETRGPPPPVRRTTSACRPAWSPPTPARFANRRQSCFGPRFQGVNEFRQSRGSDRRRQSQFQTACRFQQDRRIASAFIFDHCLHKHRLSVVRILSFADRPSPKIECGFGEPFAFAKLANAQSAFREPREMVFRQSVSVTVHGFL